MIFTHIINYILFCLICVSIIFTAIEGTDISKFSKTPKPFSNFNNPLKIFEKTSTNMFLSIYREKEGTKMLKKKIRRFLDNLDMQKLFSIFTNLG